jgi:hypothetical protein
LTHPDRNPNLSEAERRIATVSELGQLLLFLGQIIESDGLGVWSISILLGVNHRKISKKLQMRITYFQIRPEGKNTIRSSELSNSQTPTQSVNINQPRTPSAILCSSSKTFSSITVKARRTIQPTKAKGINLGLIQKPRLPMFVSYAL